MSLEIRRHQALWTITDGVLGIQLDIADLTALRDALTAEISSYTRLSKLGAVSAKFYLDVAGKNWPECLSALSVRAVNTLCNLNIGSKEDLLRLDIKELERVKNCGRRTIREIAGLQVAIRNEQEMSTLSD